MDERLFTQVVRQYQALLGRVAYALLQQPRDCADAVQDALLMAWHGRHALRDVGAMRAWLTRILIHACHATRRKRKRTDFARQAKGKALPVDNPLLQDALCALPEGPRLLLILYYLEGFSVTEVAQTMCVPAETVKNRMAQARRELDFTLSKEDVYES